jgi:hypothetical protein
VLSQTCAGDPNAPQLQAAAASSTLLLEGYINANNQPADWIYRLYGNAGPCDASAYRYTVDPGWENTLSGFHGENDCNIVTAYAGFHEDGDRQTWNGAANACGCVIVGWVGPFMNDRLNSFWLRHG